MTRELSDADRWRAVIMLAPDPRMVLDVIAAFTIGIATRLAAEHPDALLTIGSDVALGNRAARRVVQSILYHMATGREMTGDDVSGIAGELVGMTRES